MIDKILTISTGNITQSDIKFFESTGSMSVGNFEYGCFCFTHPATSQKIFEQNFPAELSRACLNIFTYARKHDCRYICFDCDADYLPGFPIFEW